MFQSLILKNDMLSGSELIRNDSNILLLCAILVHSHKSSVKNVEKRIRMCRKFSGQISLKNSCKKWLILWEFSGQILLESNKF